MYCVSSIDSEMRQTNTVFTRDTHAHTSQLRALVAFPCRLLHYSAISAPPRYSARAKFGRTAPNKSSSMLLANAAATTALYAAWKLLLRQRVGCTPDARGWGIEKSEGPQGFLSIKVRSWGAWLAQGSSMKVRDWGAGQATAQKL